MAITDSSSKILTVQESINVLAAKLADEDPGRYIKYSDISEMNKQEFILLTMPWMDDDMPDTDVKISFDEETYSYVIDLYLRSESDPSANAFDTSLYLYCGELPDGYSASFCRVSTDNSRPFYINNNLGLHNGINKISIMPFKNAIDSSYYSDNVTMVIGCTINVSFGMLDEWLSFTKFTFVYHGSRVKPTTAKITFGAFGDPESSTIDSDVIFASFYPGNLEGLSELSPTDKIYTNLNVYFTNGDPSGSIVNFAYKFTPYTNAIRPYYDSGASEEVTPTAGLDDMVPQYAEIPVSAENTIRFYGVYTNICAESGAFSIYAYMTFRVYEYDEHGNYVRTVLDGTRDMSGITADYRVTTREQFLSQPTFNNAWFTVIGKTSGEIIRDLYLKPGYTYRIGCSYSIWDAKYTN